MRETADSAQAFTETSGTESGTEHKKGGSRRTRLFLPIEIYVSACSANSAVSSCCASPQPLRTPDVLPQLLHL